MLVLTLHAGESLQATGLFELIYEGRDGFDMPVVQLFSAVEQRFTIQQPGGRLEVSSIDDQEMRQIDILIGSKLRIGETRIHFSARTNQRLKCCIEAPEDIRFIRPSQHGGSLVGG